MTLIKPSEPSFMTAVQAARRTGFAARSELQLRNALEAFCRSRWPDARIVHEMVMGEGKVRADVVALCPAHIAAFEVKGQFDDTTRLLHQVGMYSLAVPEVWMVVSEKHADDAELIRYLMPHVGLITGKGFQDYYGSDEPDKPLDLKVIAEATPRPAVMECSLELLWRAECAEVCLATQSYQATAKTMRTAMIKRLLELDRDLVWPHLCAALRGRDALWRADAPIRETRGATNESCNI